MAYKINQDLGGGSGPKQFGGGGDPIQYRAMGGFQQRPNPTGAVMPSAPSSSGSYPRGGAAAPSTLTIPAYDEQKVEGLAQSVAAPAIQKLRDQVQTVQGGVYDNPNVKAMTLRQALQGYGQGLGSAVGSAYSTAAGIYGQEYAPQVQAAEINYQGGLTREGYDLQRELQSQRLANQNSGSSYQNSFNAWLMGQQGKGY